MKRKSHSGTVWTEQYRTKFPDGVLLIWAKSDDGYMSDFGVSDWMSMETEL